MGWTRAVLNLRITLVSEKLVGEKMAIQLCRWCASTPAAMKSDQAAKQLETVLRLGGLVPALDWVYATDRRAWQRACEVS